MFFDKPILYSVVVDYAFKVYGSLINQSSEFIADFYEGSGHTYPNPLYRGAAAELLQEKGYNQISVMKSQVYLQSQLLLPLTSGKNVLLTSLQSKACLPSVTLKR